ncbi:hypothetical protein ACVTW2_000663 [Escherichia coli]
MKKILLSILMAASFSAVAGNCTYPDDVAADGSICGARAASVRAGGETPPPEYPKSDYYTAPIQTYITRGDCDNGYTFLETSQLGNPTTNQAAVIRNDKVIASSNDASDTAAQLMDGKTSVENVIVMDKSNGAFNAYSLVYNWTDVNIKKDKGVLILNKKVIAQCSVTMIGG